MQLQNAQAPYLTLTEQAAAPAAPAAGDQRLYTKTDGKLYRKDDGGVETEVGGGGTATSYDKCRAYPSANVAIPAATVTLIPLNSETYDTNAMHDTVTNNSRITIVTPGDYLVIACAQHSATTGQVQTRLHKNGVQYAISPDNGSSAGPQPKVVDVLPLIAGDYLEMAAYSSAAAENVYGGASGDVTYLTVKRLP